MTTDVCVYSQNSLCGKPKLSVLTIMTLKASLIWGFTTLYPSPVLGSMLRLTHEDWIRSKSVLDRPPSEEGRPVSLTPIVLYSLSEKTFTFRMRWKLILNKSFYKSFRGKITPSNWWEVVELEIYCLDGMGLHLQASLRLSLGALISIHARQWSYYRALGAAPLLWWRFVFAHKLPPAPRVSSAILYKADLKEPDFVWESLMHASWSS